MENGNELSGGQDLPMNKYEKKMLLYARIRTVVSAFILAVVIAVSLKVVPDLMKTLNSVNEAAEKLTEVTTELEINAEGLDELILSITEMVDDNYEGVTKALENVNNIDFDSLNSAIKDLSEVVAPLANLSNMLGR